MKDKIKITFLGTGTSSGVPLLTCKCATCLSSDIKDKRLRTSIFIQYKNQHILVDIGPDFRQQMLREDIQQIDAILLTHSHHDHVAGLDEIRAYNFSSNKAMPIYANETTQIEIKKHFDYIFNGNKYPGIADVHLQSITKNAFQVGDVPITPVEVFHNKMVVSAFRIENFAYITDIKTITEEEFDKLKGVTHLVLSVLRFEPHFSHFNYEEALEFIAKLQPKYTYFTHISHQFGKHKELSKMLPENIKVAYDGLKIFI